jgi:hypothetical protein
LHVAGCANAITASADTTRGVLGGRVLAHGVAPALLPALLTRCAAAPTPRPPMDVDAGAASPSHSARRYTSELKKWEQAKRPAPLCLGMYEPIITLMSSNVVMAALQADDTSHQNWMNQVCHATCDAVTQSDASKYARGKDATVS